LLDPFWNGQTVNVTLLSDLYIRYGMQIIKAHLIPGTLTYYDIENQVKNGGHAVYTSLQGLPWSFSWRMNVAGTGGYLVVDDLYLVTYERGFLDVEGDILNTAKNSWWVSDQTSIFKNVYIWRFMLAARYSNLDWHRKEKRNLGTMPYPGGSSRCMVGKDP
jgi:hypothetical protein